MLAVNSFDWNSIDDWTNASVEDLEKLLVKRDPENEKILSKFYSLYPERFIDLFMSIPMSYSNLNYTLDSLPISFTKSMLSSEKFKAFISLPLDNPNSLLKLLTIVMVNQSALNEITEWIGKEKFQSILDAKSCDIHLKDLLTSYYIAESTVGINSWSNPLNKTSLEDIETMYLLISDRLTNFIDVNDLKSIMFLSSMSAVKDLICNNFNQFNLLFKSFLKDKNYKLLNILYKIIGNLMAIPKPKSDQDIKMIQMKLMSMGVDQDIALDSKYLENEETTADIHKRITKLVSNYDIVYIYSTIFQLFLKNDQNSTTFKHFLESLNYLASPPSIRSKLVADGLLKMLLSCQSTEVEHQILNVFICSKLLTNTNPRSLTRNTKDLVAFIPMMYRLLHPSVDLECQMQGIMALTNLCCSGDQSVLDRIYTSSPVQFPFFLRTYMTHDVPELRRVGVELFTNMLQCEQCVEQFYNLEKFNSTDLKLLWLYIFEEDEYLQYAALGALAYLTFPEHCKQFLLNRPQIESELMEIVNMKFKLQHSSMALVAIMDNLSSILPKALKVKLLNTMNNCATDFGSTAATARENIKVLLQ